ncbi:MAG: chemotaxis protein CheW [Desulfobacterales bacterium]|nr:chemotaxis protein CheW [Desulfobacterales bacterium]
MVRQIATFFLGKTLLGIDILLVKEVYRQMSITPIPGAPNLLKGLMNLRGRVVTIIDLNVCLKRQPIQDVSLCRLLILKTEEEIIRFKQHNLIEHVDIGEDIVGLLIDTMDDVIEVKDEDILSPPSNLGEMDHTLIRGIIKRNDQLVILLNIVGLLDMVMQAIDVSNSIN